MGLSANYRTPRHAQEVPANAECHDHSALNTLFSVSLAPTALATNLRRLAGNFY